MHILLAEDDVVLREALAARLGREGFRVIQAADGIAARDIGLETTHPIVAILDLGLPGLTGQEVLNAWREGSKSFPVLILTARSTWQDKVATLGAGADDYLVKPFHFEELLARVQALVRRATGWAHSRLTCGPLVLDISAQQVLVNDEPVPLTTFEYRLLEYLVMHAGRLVTREDLATHLYNGTVPDSNALEVFVGRVRKKIDPNAELHPIETVRGRGYRFILPRT